MLLELLIPNNHHYDRSREDKRVEVNYEVKPIRYNNTLINVLDLYDRLVKERDEYANH